MASQDDAFSSALRVEFLFWRECPSHPEALATLRAVLEERGIGAPIDVVEIETAADAARHVFPGSPTIRIDGRDVDPASATGLPSLTCRVYRLPGGRPSPVPSREQIEEALS
jgi:hypothetical protein